MTIGFGGIRDAVCLIVTRDLLLEPSLLERDSVLFVQQTTGLPSKRIAANRFDVLHSVFKVTT